MKTKTVYKMLDTMPKGVLHHLHADCNEDLEYVSRCTMQIKKYVLDYPGVYLHKDVSAWHYGTPEQAKVGEWITPK